MKKNPNSVIFLIDLHNVVVAVAVVVAVVATALGVIPTMICNMIHCIYDVLVDLVVVETYRHVI